MKKTIMMLVYFFCLGGVLFAQDETSQKQTTNKLSSYDPFYVGPLIADGGDNLSPGIWSFTHSARFFNTYGVYNSSWTFKSSRTVVTFNPTTSITVGLLDWLELKFFDLEALANYKNSQSSFNITDYEMAIGLQVMREDDSHVGPSIRFLFKEVFPTGKYRNLSSVKNRIDSTGSGAFTTVIELALSKYIHWFYNHPINFYFNLGCGLPTTVKVKGFNAYGGGFNTDGKVKPGKTINALLAFEFSFTQKCAFAMDLSYNYASKTTFKGTPGTNNDGTVATNFTGSSQLFSLTPGIEYNFNDDIGLLFSSWFSVYGKNSTDFAGGIISLNYKIGNS